MAKFVYRMQSLLNIKEKLEEQEKTAYGLAKARLNEEETTLYGLTTRRAGYLEQKREGMSGALQVIELVRIEQAIKAMDLLIAEQRVVVLKARKAVEIAQVRLENAMKERKIQEKLRENALEEFLKEEEAKEQKEINELVTFRFGSAKKEEA